MPNFSVYLRPGLDDDIADRLSSEANQCEAIRQALRAWYGQANDLTQRLDRIEALLSGAAIQMTQMQNDAVDATVLDEVMKGW